MKPLVLVVLLSISCCALVANNRLDGRAEGSGAMSLTLDKPDDLSSVSARLLRHDWNFPTSDSSDGLHSIHPYPAKFIPEIPRTLLRELVVPAGTALLDPFCGSGTALAAAQAENIPAIGVDLNPIACLISRVKTTRLPRAFDVAARECVRLAKRYSDVELPSIPNVDHWFQAPIQQSLARILVAIGTTPDNHLRDHFRVALSSIIVRVSNQESDTRYAAVAKRVTAEETFRWFLQACEKLQAAKRELASRQKVHVLHGDILDTHPSEIPLKVGIVVTSPPYPNAYEYWLYHKYRMWWLGFDPLQVKDREIGARPKYFCKNSATPEDFRRQMSTVFHLVRKVLVPRGHACIVVGDSVIHGRVIDNAALLSEAANEQGFAEVLRIPRRIADSRKSFNLAHARIKSESILVYKLRA